MLCKQKTGFNRLDRPSIGINVRLVGEFQSETIQHLLSEERTIHGTLHIFLGIFFFQEGNYEFSTRKVQVE